MTIRGYEFGVFMSDSLQVSLAFMGSQCASKRVVLLFQTIVEDLMMERDNFLNVSCKLYARLLAFAYYSSIVLCYATFYTSFKKLLQDDL